MSVIKNNKNYGTRVVVEQEPFNPYPEYLTATYSVTVPSNNFNILNSTSNVSGWRFKGDTVWQTPVTDITVTEYGMVEIEFDLVDSTKIGSSQFKNCQTLVKIELPASVTTIEESGFYRSGLIELPNLQNVTVINNDPFYDCFMNRSSYILNDSVDRSGWAVKCMNTWDDGYIPNMYVNGVVYRAIRYWSNGDDIDLQNGINGMPIYKWRVNGWSRRWNLNSIKFPSTLTHIISMAFRDCTITSLYFYGTTPPVCEKMENLSIWLNSNITNIFVPAEALTAYQNSPDFADVASKIQAMP